MTNLRHILHSLSRYFIVLKNYRIEHLSSLNEAQQILYEFFISLYGKFMTVPLKNVEFYSCNRYDRK